MPAEQLTTISRMNVVFGAIAVATSGLLWGGRGMLAAGAGAVLSAANFWALRRLGARAVARVEAGATGGQAMVLVGSLVGKMTLLFGLVWLAVRGLHLSIIPFTVGLSSFVASALLGGLYLGPRGSDDRDADAAVPASPSSPISTSER